MTNVNSQPNIAGWPNIALEDTAERLTLFMPEGTPLMRWYKGEAEPRSRPSIGHSVLVFYPDRRYMVTLWYDGPSGMRAPWVNDYFPGGEPEGRFHGWKVDFQSPYGRLDQGIDMIDEILDLAVRPDRTYSWRDEDEMARMVAAGIYTAAEAQDWRQVGIDAIKEIEQQSEPFSDEWKRWEPPPGIELGPIPEGWQHWPLAAPYREYQPWAGFNARPAS
jgi:hypothetical protein